ncbi:MAG: hypothetical protein HYY67_05095 [Thaumarchaeota archaeon]|nr:hypothetical protein [Nitrososphaerota archaeon]
MGHDVYPHCLRKTFEDCIKRARLDHEDQEFLKGHLLGGSQDNYYGAVYVLPNSTVSFNIEHIEQLRGNS